MATRARDHAVERRARYGHAFEQPVFGHAGSDRLSARSATWPCKAPLFWGPILYYRMALTGAGTPSVRPVGRTSSCGRLHVGQGKAMHGSRQTHLPVEAIEKTLDVLVAQRQHLHEQQSGPEPLEANRRAILYWQRELAEARRPTSASA